MPTTHVKICCISSPDEARLADLQEQLEQAQALAADWEWAFEAHQPQGGYRPDPVSSGMRALANLALANLVVGAYIFIIVPEYLLRFIAWVLSRGVYRLRFVDTAHIPTDGPAVLVCNHVSFVDAVLLMAASPRPIRFLMDHRIFRVPVLGALFRLAKAIPVAPRQEDPAAYEAAFAAADAVLADGELFLKLRFHQPGERHVQVVATEEQMAAYCGAGEIDAVARSAAIDCVSRGTIAVRAPLRRAPIALELDLDRRVLPGGEVDLVRLVEEAVLVDLDRRPAVGSGELAARMRVALRHASRGVFVRPRERVEACLAHERSSERAPIRAARDAAVLDLESDDLG